MPDRPQLEENHTPSQEALYSRVKDVELMERVTARIRDRIDDHNGIWREWHRQEDSPGAGVGADVVT